MIDSKSQPVELDMTFDVYFPGSLKPSSSICYILFSSEEKYFGALLLFHKIPLKLKVDMTRKIFSAYLKGLSKYRDIDAFLLCKLDQ